MRENHPVSTRKESWQPILDSVFRLLNELDPYALEPGSDDGAPVDEYGPEARPIASLLVNRGLVTAADIDAIWTTWFDEPLSAVVGDRFPLFVTQLNALA